MSDIKDQVKAQFGRAAHHYTTSQVHATGDEFAVMLGLANLTGQQDVLDIATGAGHTALAFAAGARRVVALDLTPQMLEQTAAGAEARGLTNVEPLLGDAERLPFADASFDLVVCRYAAHHFPHIAQAMAEASRVLRPSGQLMIVDNFSPADPDLDRWVNQVEKLRDASHVREYSLAEWEGYFRQVGLSYELSLTWMLYLEFESWTARIGTPPAEAAVLRNLFRTATPAQRECFGIQDDPLAFHLHTCLLRGAK